MDEERCWIDHLHRSCDDSEEWNYPFEEDIQYADKDQIPNCKVEGTWGISGSWYKSLTYLMGMIFSKYFKSISEASVSIC